MLGSITTISISAKAKEDAFRQLTDLIGHQVRITSYCYEEMPSGGNFRDDLVLITTSFIEARCRPLLAPDCPCLVAKRNLDLSYIHLLMEIPEGNDVLVVNNIYENAREVITELATFGINQYHFFPYNPHEPLSREFRYAITLGEFDPVLERIPHVYDIGTRQINLLTVAEILHFFTGRIIVDELITSRYVKTSVQTIMNLNGERYKNSVLQAQLAAIVEGFDDGVLVLEYQGKGAANFKVAFCNDMVRQVLQKDPLKESLPDWLTEAIKGKENGVFFLQQENRELQVEVRKIYDGNRKVRLLILKDIALIRKIDVNYCTYQKAQGHSTNHTFQDILCIDKNMQQVIESARQMANSLSNILITGESGTGKEIMAQAIHNESPFCRGPFVAFNCGAISESLLESELFGYDEGAFTGACRHGKIGLIELAHNGTLFLDEIGDAPLSIQQKLLRVIQEKTILRVAGRQPIHVNIRIIAATNQDLPALIKEKRFRNDLYYRLNVLFVHLPALRQRKADIPLLFHFFLKKHLALHDCAMVNISQEVNELLQSYEWPGNVRELQNLCEYLTNHILHGKKPLLTDKIRGYMMRQSQGLFGELAAIDQKQIPDLMPLEDKPLTCAMEEKIVSREGRFILEALYQLSLEGRLISQQHLQAYCRQWGREYTAYRIKSILNGLQALKMVESVVGRGTSLTESGLQYLRNQKPGRSSASVS